MRSSTVYARVWRWHFFAGLWVAPFGVLLALSGSVYLFAPQIDAFLQERIERGLPRETSLDADRLLTAALQQVGGGRLVRFRLPEAEDATARIEVQPEAGERQLVWVERSSGDVVYTLPASSHPLQIAKQLHGELLTGRIGSAFVELAASWMIVLLCTGAYLAWPAHGGWRRTLFPRLGLRRRPGLRNLHVGLGFWMGAGILLFLLSGLPWSGLFGSGLGRVQEWTGQQGPGQEFRVTLQSEAPPGPTVPELGLAAIVELASRETLVPPVEISPPGGSSGVWTVRSMTPRRPDRVTLHYDRYTGAEIERIDFQDYPPFKKAVAFGIALHEGQLFGPANQIFGVIVALGVVVLCVTGPLLWWKRRPIGGWNSGGRQSGRRSGAAWGVPALPGDSRIGAGLVALVVLFALILPTVGLSLVFVLLLDTVWTIWAGGRGDTSSETLGVGPVDRTERSIQ